MRRHTERDYVIFKAIVLELLAQMAFMTIHNEQPITPHLTRLCMRVKVLQPLKTQLAICPTVLRYRELPDFRCTYLLVPCRDVYNPLDDCYPLSIAWLDEFRSSASLGTSNDFRGRSDTHLKASFIEVVDVIVLDAVLGFGILNKLELRLDSLGVFLDFSLIVFCSIKSHLELF